MAATEIIHLTLAGGKPFRVRKENVIAAHEALPSETTPEGKTKIYLSSGGIMFVRESPEEAVLE